MSKNLSRSIEATHTLPAFASAATARMASWAERPGRKPKLLSWKVGSNIGASACATACCTIRSTAVGMPSSLTLPSPFGISARLTGLGL